MDNIDNKNVTEEQVEQQSDEIQFNYDGTTVSKPLFELKKADTMFAVYALIVGIFSMVFGVFGGFAFGYLLSVVFMFILLSIYFAKGKTVHVWSIVCGVLSLANGAVFICTTNGSVRFFAVIIGFLLSLVCFDGIINGTALGNRQTLGIFYSAASTMENISVSLKSLFLNSNGDKKAIGKVFVGLLCSVPVLIVVVPLLLKSDDAFSGMMSSILSGSGNVFITILKVVLGAVTSLFVISYGFSLKSGRISKIKEGKFKGVENACLVSFLSAISICYLLYLFSQLAYFFSAFSGFLPNDKITYAEYARKGFFEMCIIAVINLGVVFLSIMLAKKDNGAVCVGIKIMTTFISGFTLIIVATAISKMVLYINEFGMTVLRITTSAFMIFLSVVFIAVILKIYISKINIVKTSLVTAGIVVLLLGTINVNALCARYNYEGYKEGRLETIDIETLYNLGDEGIPYVVKLACSKEGEVAKEAQRYLKKAYKYDYFYNTYAVKSFTIEDFKKNSKDKGFERFNIPQKRAYDYLYAFLEKNPSFCASTIEGTGYENSIYN